MFGLTLLTNYFVVILSCLPTDMIMTWQIFSSIKYSVLVVGLVYAVHVFIITGIQIYETSLRNLTLLYFDQHLILVTQALLMTLLPMTLGSSFPLFAFGFYLDGFM